MAGMMRSRKDRVFGGVCGGIARSMGIHGAWVRLLFVIGAFVVPPVAFFGYLLLWVILPREEKGERAAEPDSAEKSANAEKVGRITSIVIASALIVTGALFLIPGAWGRVFDISAIFAALMLLAAAVKLGYDVLRTGEKSFVRVSAAAVAATIAVFLLLTTFRVLQTGVYVEYCKYILAAFLIVGGIAMMTRETPWKMIGIYASLAVYLLIAILSASKSNYDVMDVPKRVMAAIVPKNFSLPKNVSVGGFGRIEALPEGTKSVEYRFNCAGGSLSVYPGTNLLEYRGDGFRPEEKVERVEGSNGGFWRVSFDNKLASCDAKFAKTVAADFAFTVSGGSLYADLRAGRVEKITAEVSAGSFDIDAGTSLRLLDIKSSAGSVNVKLPRKSTLKLSIADNLSSLDLPAEFKHEGAGYVYNGGGEVTLEAVISVTTGNVRISLE